MRKKRTYQAKKPDPITRKEHAGAALYHKALVELPALIRKLRAEGRVKVAPPLSKTQTERIQRGLNKYGREHKGSVGAGTGCLV